MRKNGKTLKCLVCGKECYIPKARLNKFKYCSPECRVKSISINARRKIGDDYCSILRNEYLAKKKTFRELCKKYGTSQKVLKDCMVECDIPIRHGSEAIKSQWEGTRGKQRRENEKNKAISKFITTDGYYAVKVDNHPRAFKKYYMKEHIVVMEKHLGRYLSDNEVVHHKNGDKLDNRIENLQIMTASEHHKHHYRERKIHQETGQFVSSKGNFKLKRNKAGQFTREKEYHQS